MIIINGFILNFAGNCLSPPIIILKPDNVIFSGWMVGIQMPPQFSHYGRDRESHQAVTFLDLNQNLSSGDGGVNIRWVIRLTLDYTDGPL
jgi:hypothetical protein